MTNDVIARKRRRRRRLRIKMPLSQHIFNAIYAVFIIVFVSSILAVGISTVYHEVTTYNDSIEHLESQGINVKTLASKVGDTAKEEESLALKLYTAIGDYINKVNDPALSRLYERAIAETPEEFQSDISRNMVSIIVFLDRHEDVQYDVGVAQALFDLETCQTYKNNLIASYNDAVDSYNFWASEYKGTFMYRHFKSKRITIENFSKYAVKTMI